MKLAIRDDDLNYFFNPDKIEKNYKEIWPICPVSMSVIPYIKGDWPARVKEFEKKGPGFIDENKIRSIRLDNVVHPINENHELVKFIKEKISSKHIYLTIHAIHHLNEDTIVPQIKSNFGIGAEFYTNRDLTEQLSLAVKFIEDTFGQKIEIFTPPQNMMNSTGLTAVVNNGLSICGDLPSIKKIETINILKFNAYSKYLLFKITHRGVLYPYPIINKSIKWIGHHRLQPGSNLKQLYQSFEMNYKFDAPFVLSTHSYGFNYKMKGLDATLGRSLRDFIRYAAMKKNIQFVNLKQIFETG